MFYCCFTLTVKPEPAAPTVDKPALSEEEIERKSKSIIDEFLHINDYKVSHKKINSRRDSWCLRSVIIDGNGLMEMELTEILMV